jgi:phage major head subunit gpT-like protein
MIHNMGSNKYPDLEAKAIEDGWSVEKFEGELRNKMRPDTSAVQMSSSSHGETLKSTALEAIALASSGTSMTFLEAHYQEQTLDMIDKYRGVGIQEFVQLACAGRYMPNPNRDCRGWLEAAFSSASLPGILSNIANKVLLEGFSNVDDTWKKVVKTASVNDFKTHTRYRMNGAFKFEQVAQDGSMKHGEISEDTYSQKVDTYGIMFGITRQMIIDDDLGAFAEIPKGIGGGAGEAISDAVWQLILHNPLQKDGKAFFSKEHRNIVSSAKAKLDIEGLTAAELAFSEQERAKGRPLGIPASILLVPSALKVAAEMLMKSLTVQVTTKENQPQPADNPHAGKFEVVSTPYLSTPSWSGSASDWYLLADPKRLAAFEVAFLGGKDRPTVERADADFDRLGIQFRGYIDFGVKEQDHRGALKMSPTT